MEFCGCKAYEEAIPVFGDATAKGLPLYLRNGGKEIGRIILEEQVVQQAGKTEPVRLGRLETPVLRWDSNWASPERLEKMRAQLAN